MVLPPPVTSQALYLIAHSEKLLDLPALLAEKCRAAFRREMSAWAGTPAESALGAVRVDSGD
jgi:hypothetical protein